jgi:hypothetical protein
MNQKLALPILSAAIMALAACSHGYDVRTAYGCTGPDAAETCKYPTTADAIIIGGKPYQYLHYRDNVEGREFYVDGTWRKADPGQPYGARS